LPADDPDLHVARAVTHALDSLLRLLVLRARRIQLSLRGGPRSHELFYALNLDRRAADFSFRSGNLSLSSVERGARTLLLPGPVLFGGRRIYFDSDFYNSRALVYRRAFTDQHPSHFAGSRCFNHDEARGRFVLI
jgi:hypothetical protein